MVATQAHEQPQREPRSKPAARKNVAMKKIRDDAKIFRDFSSFLRHLPTLFAS
jgi:hypothetical protein